MYMLIKDVEHLWSFYIIPETIEQVFILHKTYILITQVAPNIALTEIQKQNPQPLFL